MVVLSSWARRDWALACEKVSNIWLPFPGFYKGSWVFAPGQGVRLLLAHQLRSCGSRASTPDSPSLVRTGVRLGLHAGAPVLFAGSGRLCLLGPAAPAGPDDLVHVLAEQPGVRRGQGLARHLAGHRHPPQRVSYQRVGTESPGALLVEATAPDFLATLLPAQNIGMLACDDPNVYFHLL